MRSTTKSFIQSKIKEGEFKPEPKTDTTLSYTE